MSIAVAGQNASSLFYFKGERWVASSLRLDQPIVATGGTVTEATDGPLVYRIHTFSSVGSGTFAVLDAGVQGEVEYLLVAGGGAGGAAEGVSAGDGGGGGGAGGLLTNLQTVGFNVAVQSYSVVVGAGGVGTSAVTGSCATTSATKGGDSSAFGLTAFGGGVGGSTRNRGGTFKNGGSGGGAGGNCSNDSGCGGDGGTGTSLQGNNGGNDLAFNLCQNTRGGAGGGGAGAAGTNNNSAAGSAGGSGLSVSITGTTTVYAGGGGGGRGENNATGGAGGSGGGGVGGGSSNATAGTNGLGGGGGGGRAASGADARGGNGGSGIVIIRYPIAFAA